MKLKQSYLEGKHNTTGGGQQNLVPSVGVQIMMEEALWFGAALLSQGLNRLMSLMEK